MAGTGADRTGDGDRDEYEPETLEDWDPVGAWRYQVDDAVRRGDFAHAERLREAGPPPGPGPSELAFSPRILAVEVGADPGGALAVAACARYRDRLSLVITMGDPEGARFARYLLDLLGRQDVGVVSSSAPAPRETAIVGLTPPHVPAQSSDVIAAVRGVAASYPHIVHWGNCGALTDLAAIYAAEPTLADRLSCTIAAGPIDAQHVAFASDPRSAMTAIATLRRPPLQVQDPRVDGGLPMSPNLVTAGLEGYTLPMGSPTQLLLADTAAPDWARLLGQHFSKWFGQGHSTASLYPVVTVAELAGVPYFDYDNRNVSVDSNGRVHLGDSGTEMWTTLDLFEPAILIRWLHDVLGLAGQPQ